MKVFIYTADMFYISDYIFGHSDGIKHLGDMRDVLWGQWRTSVILCRAISQTA